MLVAGQHSSHTINMLPGAGSRYSTCFCSSAILVELKTEFSQIQNSIIFFKKSPPTIITEAKSYREEVLYLLTGMQSVCKVHQFASFGGQPDAVRRWGHPNRLSLDPHQTVLSWDSRSPALNTTLMSLGQMSHAADPEPDVEMPC